MCLVARKETWEKEWESSFIHSFIHSLSLSLSLSLFLSISLSHTQVTSLVSQIREKLWNAESKAAEYAADVWAREEAAAAVEAGVGGAGEGESKDSFQDPSSSSSSSALPSSSSGGGVEGSSDSSGAGHGSNEGGLQRAVEVALLALKLLPQEACPIVVIATDGVNAEPGLLGSAAYDGLLMQVRRYGEGRGEGARGE